MPDFPAPDLPVAATVNARRSASTCRWATPTLFLPAPFWFEAEDSPWTCLRDPAPRPLNTTDPCAICLRWEPQSSTASSETLEQVARSPFLDEIHDIPGGHKAGLD